MKLFKNFPYHIYFFTLFYPPIWPVIKQIQPRLRNWRIYMRIYPKFNINKCGNNNQFIYHQIDHHTMLDIKGFQKIFPNQVFLPTSWFMIIWYFLVLIILALDFALTIIFICFRSQEANRALRDGVLPILTIICFFDILITFNTSFLKNGQLIQDRKQIFSKYMLSWYFLFDVLALIVAICQIILRYSFQDKLPFLNLLILIKIVKGIEYDRLIKKYIIRSQTGLLYYAMAKNLILLTFVCHIIGSFFFYLDLKLIELGWYENSMLWIKNSYAYLNIIDLPIFYQYSYGFYYAVVTLTGTAYGDLTPLNPTETAYTFMAVAMPMIIYAYLFSVIYNAIYERRKSVVEATQYKRKALHYFRDIGIPQKKASTFMNYLSFVYDKKVAVDNNFMDEIGPSVRDSYFKLNIQFNYDFSIFNMLTRPSLQISDIKQLIYELIKEEIYPQKQVLMANMKDCTKKLYFIISGSVSKMLSLKNKYANSLHNKQFFGMFPFFTGLNEQTPNFFYQTHQFTITQTIDHSKLIFLIREAHNIILFQSYHMLRDQVLFMQETEMIREKCFFCESTKHMIEKCPHLKPQVQIQNILEKKQRRTMYNSRKTYKTRKMILRKTQQKNRVTQEKWKEEGVQTQKQQKMTMNQKIRNEEVEKAYNWTVFFPSSSL